MAVKTNYNKNGNSYYRVTATVGKDANGRYIRKEFYGKSKKEAEEKRDEYLANIRAGLTADYKEKLLGQCMHDWLFNVAKVKIKPSTFDRYEGIYRNYIKNTELTSLPLYSIKSIILQKHYNSLKELGKTSASIRNLNKLLKTFFNYCINEDMMLKNPCNNIIIPGTAQELAEKNIHPFSSDEINKIKAASDGYDIDIIFLILLGTGLRVGELLAITENDISFETKTITISKNIKKVRDIVSDDSYEHKIIIQTPKTENSVRIVPIPEPLIAVLKTHINKQKIKHLSCGVPYDKNCLLFTTEFCNPLDGGNLRRAWERLLKRANVEHRGMHSIRHTYATKLFEAGVPIKTVSDLLGHSDIKVTTDIYVHVMAEVKTDAAEKLSFLFM